MDVDEESHSSDQSDISLYLEIIEKVTSSLYNDTVVKDLTLEDFKDLFIRKNTKFIERELHEQKKDDWQEEIDSLAHEIDSFKRKTEETFTYFKRFIQMLMLVFLLIVLIYIEFI